MVQTIISILHDSRLVAMILAGVAAFATVLTIAMPLLALGPAAQAHEIGSIEQKIRQRSASGWRAAIGDVLSCFVHHIVKDR